MDSDGETGVLVERIYQLWLELLNKVSNNEKQKMFQWFTTHLDGSIIDYLEEYIEEIIMEEFQEKEFEQPKLDFIKEKIQNSSAFTSDWSESYHTGKWAIRYLGILEKGKAPGSQIEEFCREYWEDELSKL